MISNLLIVDTETTGLDSKVDQIVEIGAVLYSVEAHTTVLQMSTLVPARANPAEKINRIPERALALFSGIPTYASTMLRAMAGVADVFVAHNYEFDRGFLTAMDLELWSSRPWIDTRGEFPWKEGKPGDSLVNLVLAHGLGIGQAHRALTDCQMIARLFDLYPEEELQAGLHHALLPRSVYLSLTSFDEKHLCKEAGFQWNPEKKGWFKKLTEAEAEALPFKVRKVA